MPQGVGDLIGTEINCYEGFSTRLPIASARRECCSLMVFASAAHGVSALPFKKIFADLKEFATASELFPLQNPLLTER
jgi:hypothetical protein